MLHDMWHTPQLHFYETAKIAISIGIYTSTGHYDNAYNDFGYNDFDYDDLTYKVNTITVTTGDIT